MRPLLALLLLTPCPLLAQLPDYVPTNGLVAYYGFNGDANDQSGNENHGTVYNLTLTEDRFGNPESCMLWPSNSNASNYIDIGYLSDQIPGEITLSTWFYADGGYIGPRVISCGPWGISSNTSSNTNRAYSANWPRAGGAFYPASNLISSLAWHHTVFTADSSGFAKWYVDGILVETKQGGFNPSYVVTHPWNIGRKSISAYDAWGGMIDDVGIWNRALDSAEVVGLFLANPPQLGCTDTAACNYSEEAAIDDGSCEYGCLYCGENTVWDTTLQACIGVTAPADTVYIEPEACAPSCGEGTVWDPVNEECIIAIPADLNYDGCVTVSDLLVLLAVHGTCPSYPGGPDTPIDTSWACGDPITFSGYGYGTIEIGSQCWFSTNVRVLPEVSPPSEGSEQDGLPHAYIPGYYGNDILEGLNLPEFQLYGVLYNSAALVQWDLCPSGWHIPSPSEWNTLVAYAGGGIAGSNLKNSENDVPAWNGTNIYGFGAAPSGEREVNGSFILINNRASFWANQPTWGRYISGDSVSEFSNYPSARGLSVRCLKD